MLKEKSLFTYFLEAFTKNYANFKGRSRRREYWGFALWYCVIFLVSIVLAILTGIGVIQGNSGANKFGEDPLIDNQAITDKTNS